jgi:hypothetical protein
MQRVKAVSSLLLLLALAAVPGCAGPETAAPGAGRFTVKKKTPFYKYGPAQAVGPDFPLDSGTQLTVIKRESGYSQIMLDNGQSGYIATEALGPVEVKPAPTLESGTAKKKSSRPRRAENDFIPPPMEEPPLPLPEPAPEQQPPPFRY